MSVPDELSKAAAGIWEMINEQFALEDDQKIILRVAIQQWDRAQEARKMIEAEGAILTLPNGYRQQHPAVKVEGQALGAFFKAWKLLGFDMEQVNNEIGRPPG